MISTESCPYSLNVPAPALNAVKARVDDATKMPLSPFIVPAPVRARVEVVTPEPMTNKPVLDKVDVNSLLPETVPIFPAFVAAPVKVMVAVVEVTVVPAPIFDVPVIAKVEVVMSKVPAPVVTSVPPIVRFLFEVNVPDALVTVTLLNVKAPPPFIETFDVPVKSIVLVPAVKVPLLVKRPFTLRVEPQGLKVPMMRTEPATPATPDLIFVVVAVGIITGDVEVGTPPQVQLAATCQLLVGSCVEKVQEPACAVGACQVKKTKVAHSPRTMPKRGRNAWLRNDWILLII